MKRDQSRNTMKREESRTLDLTHPAVFDYKDVETLQRYLSPQARIHSAKRTALGTRKQRELKRAIKYARFLSLMPYTS